MDHNNLYPFQKKIYERCKDLDNFAFFMDMGVGKTPTTICVIKYKWALNGAVMKTIIFCPIIVLDNWKNEFLAWTKLNAKHIGVVKGTFKKRLKIIENPDHHILIVNYECTRSRPVVDALKKFKAQIVACDESHKIKTYKSVKDIINE